MCFCILFFVGAIHFNIKCGSFDNDIDLKTIDIELDQQIYGPFILSTRLEFNIDKDSKNNYTLYAPTFDNH